MKFWDSSAVVPLLVTEADSGLRDQQLTDDPDMVVWFGTLAKIESALARRRRSHDLSPEAESQARNYLRYISPHWKEVSPTREVRARAIRLLRAHSLRAADAFQLAAALVFCRERPERLPFLTADHNLRAAAKREGFLVG